jgi:hypothetical protein
MNKEDFLKLKEGDYIVYTCKEYSPLIFKILNKNKEEYKTKLVKSGKDWVVYKEGDISILPFIIKWHRQLKKITKLQVFQEVL